MIGRKFTYLEQLNSTNNYFANKLLEQKIEHGSVIMAGEQTLGKGQRGAKWDAEPFKNLTLSVYLEHANLSVSNHFYLTQSVALAVNDFLSDFGRDFKIKWPNDLVFQNKKIAGILIEGQIEKDKMKSSIVGLGINVNQEIFGDYNAISISSVTRSKYDLRELAFKLCEKIEIRFQDLISRNYTKISEDYKTNLWLLGEISQFSDAEGEFEGKITDVDEFGRLEVLKVKDNQVKYYQNKEITFLERRI